LRLSKKDEKTVESGEVAFFGEGTHEEFVNQEREESGMKGWYDRIKNL